MTAPRVGETAPDFSLQTHDGTTVRLSDFAGKSAVVLIFYPMDQTPGCTAQLRRADADAARYADAGAVVFGVNNGSAPSHKRFADRQRFKVPLLVDEGLQVAGAYGAATGFGGLRVIRRTVVGIAPSGTIVFYQRGTPSTDEILAALPQPA